VRPRCHARGATELNATLHEVVAGIWFELEPERDRLLAKFQLRTPIEPTLPGGVPLLLQLKRERMSLAPQRPGVAMDPGWELVARKLDHLPRSTGV
jgi:hypothetical protein